MERVNETVEKDPVSIWLDKTEYEGKTVEFIVHGLYDNNGPGIGLVPKDDPNEEMKLLNFRGKFKNDVIDKLGANSSNWDGSVIKINFTRFVPKPNQKNMSEGIMSTLVLDTEQQVNV